MNTPRLYGLIAAGFLASLAHADERPLPQWELGVGASALRIPDYRGSDESQVYALPIPYFVYRGDKIKVDKDGVRGELFNTDRARLEISLGATVPVDSSHNRARAGMPDLDATVEVGPSFEVTLARSEDRRVKFDFRLPVRTGFTIGSSNFGRSVGLVATPSLNLDIRDVAGLPGWNLGLVGGLMFGSARNHAYYYSVDAQYAATNRPAYAAQGGYGGTQMVVALTKRYDQWWVGAFARADSLGHAVFADSPLVRSKSYVTAGVGVAWIFKESSR
jgi:outer membrane protein